MGWTQTQAPRDEKAFVRDLYTWRNAEREVRPIAMGRQGRTWYLACEDVHTKSGTRAVWAGVCRITRDARDPDYGFGYRTDDESVGPNEAKCPQRILDLLTATEHRHANDWRERCRVWHARQRAARRDRLYDGERIEFDAPIRFADGREERSFRVRRMRVTPGAKRRTTLLEGPDGVLYRVPGLATRTDWYRCEA